jgi:hypothetical protein
MLQMQAQRRASLDKNAPMQAQRVLFGLLTKMHGRILE